MPSKPARERELDRLIKAAEKLAANAEKAGSYGPARAAKNDAASLRAERERLRQVRLAERVKDPAHRLRRFARLAQDEGSWVAAARLLSEAQAVEDKMAELAEAADDLDNLSVEDALALVVGLIEVLPESQVEAIGEAVARRLGGELELSGEG